MNISHKFTIAISLVPQHMHEGRCTNTMHNKHTTHKYERRMRATAIKPMISEMGGWAGEKPHRWRHKNTHKVATV